MPEYYQCSLRPGSTYNPPKDAKETPTKHFLTATFNCESSLGGGNVSTDSPNGRRGTKTKGKKTGGGHKMGLYHCYKWSDMGNPYKWSYFTLLITGAHLQLGAVFPPSSRKPLLSSTLWMIDSEEYNRLEGSDI